MRSTVSLTNLLGERVIDIDVNPDSFQAYALTSKKKELFAVSMVSKLDPNFNEKKLVKKHSLPKSAVNHNKLAFVLSKSILLLYSDEVHVTVFDCKKEAFQKSLLIKTDGSRRSAITSLAVSPCGNFILLADLLGDLQLWSIQAKSIDLVHCSNLSTRGILCVEFIKNDYSNQLSHAICYSLDQQIYLIDFEQISKGNYSLVLANKFNLPGSTDISIKEYKTLGIRPFLSASRHKNCFRIHALKVSRMSDGSLIPATQTVDYTLEEKFPVDTQVLFPKFHLNGVMKGFDSTNFSFTCESAGEIFFLTLQGVFVYVVTSGATRQILGFDSVFSKGERLPNPLNPEENSRSKGVFELNKLVVSRVEIPQKHVLIYAAVTLDKMSLSASLVCVLLDTKSWRIKGEPLVLPGVVDFSLVEMPVSEQTQPQPQTADAGSAEDSTHATEQLTVQKLWVIEEFHRTLSSHHVKVVKNNRTQSVLLQHTRLSQRELHESVQRIVGGGQNRGETERIRFYSKVREAVFVIHGHQIEGSGIEPPSSEVISLANDCLAEVKLEPGEILKDCFTWQQCLGSSGMDTEPNQEGHSNWSWGLITTLRICLFSANEELVCEIRVASEYINKSQFSRENSKQIAPKLARMRICGVFEQNLILQSEESIFSQKLPGKVKSDLLDSPNLLLHIDSTNTVLVGLLPDRVVTAKTHLQENDKTIAVEFQQRHGSSLNLMLQSYLEHNESLPTSECLESLVSVMWESQLTPDTILAVLKRACDRVHLELACRFGGADELYEQVQEDFILQDNSVKEYLLGRMKDFLVTPFTANKETPPAEVIRRYRGELFADHAIEELYSKVATLLKLKLLLVEENEENPSDASEDQSQVSKILPKIGDLVAQHELSKKNQRLKKKDVPFGQEVYRMYDSWSGGEFNLLNNKDLLGYLGFSKTRVPATNPILGKDDRTNTAASLNAPDADADSDTEAEGGFKSADDECAGLLFLWRMDEDLCPQVKDTTERRINGVIKGQGYKWEQFRGDCPLEFEDKWGKVGWWLTNRVFLSSFV